MEDQMVSFEVAKLAEEVGFCSNIGLGYKKRGGNYYNPKGELNGNCLKPNEERVNETDYFYVCIAAPTQSLLQRWLREIHHLHVWCGVSENQYFVYINENELDYWKCSYETALEFGLKEALVILKSKQ